MNKSQKKIFNLLEQKPMSLSELTKTSGYSKSGIRGRIAELKLKYDYDITKVDGRYILSTENSKFYEYINNLTGNAIDVNRVSRATKIPVDKIKSLVSKLISEGKAIQVSNTQFVVKRFD